MGRLDPLDANCRHGPGMLLLVQLVRFCKGGQDRACERWLLYFTAVRLSAWELDGRAVFARTSQASGYLRLSETDHQIPVSTLPSGMQRARQGFRLDLATT